MTALSRIRALLPLALTVVAALLSPLPAWALCPKVQIPPDFPDVVVPTGCDYMQVKIWGNGGNAGHPTGGAFTGRGGGGAALTAVYRVQPGQQFRALVQENLGPNLTWPGFASTFSEITGTESTLLLIAGGGGGGGSQWVAGQRPDGGAAGGLAGQAGQGTSTNGFSLGPGLGGTQGGGGAGGTGKQFSGVAGGPFPCAFNTLPPCGHGPGGGGVGGQGYFGGGGGGTYSLGGVSAGGGGSSSFVAPHPTLMSIRRYDGNRETPGNALDPDRQGAGQGGVKLDSTPVYAPGTKGRVVVTFFGELDIDEEATTRWKPMRSDEEMEIVFESALELELHSAILKVTAPGGQVLFVHHHNLEQLGTNPFRYKVRWTGPWTRTVEGQVERLPAGDYTIVVRGIPIDGNGPVSSEPYNRISLVEVSSVTLESDPGNPLEPNPTLVAVTGQHPSQERLYRDGTTPRPGQRIFSESPTPSGTARRTVTVRINTTPTISNPPPSTPPITVRIKSFDVDDPARPEGTLQNRADVDLDSSPLGVADNRGAPCGALRGGGCTASITVPFGQSAATIGFAVSSQPGDNYRVAASTSQDWLDKLVAVQPSDHGEIKRREGASSVVALDEAERKCVSELLTVWRTLHLEVDASRPRPTDATHPQRNFLRGTVNRIGTLNGKPNVPPTTLWLVPEATDPPLGLDDGSPDFGRFHKGTIVVGATGATETYPSLSANGSDYVLRITGFNIPFGLVNAAGGGLIRGSLRTWQDDVFTVDTSLPSGYDGGTLTVLGVSWPVVTTTHGTAIQVVPGATELPFELVDDDTNEDPVPPSNFYLTTGSDNPSTNSLAQAYVRIAPPLTGTDKRARFKRNTTDDEAILQILGPKEGGRDDTTVHRPEFWAGYLQGAFQGPTYTPPTDLTAVPATGDGDPDEEAGATLGYAPGFSLSIGALVYMQSIREVVCGSPVSFEAVVSRVALHEVGHQFDLRHEHGDVMTQGQPCSPVTYFSDIGLHFIRRQGLP